jgi:hypothetical protein
MRSAGLEKVLPHLLGHTDTVIGDDQLDVVRVVRCSERDFPAGMSNRVLDHRSDRSHHEIAWRGDAG